MKGLKLEELFAKLFPVDLAYSWDNVGLQIGTFDSEVTGVMVALNCTLDVIDEAIEHGCNFIFVHHPLIFQPLKVIQYQSPVGKILQKLIKNDISLYVAHTNFDVIEGGMNDVLADLFNLKNTSPIEMVTDDLGLGRIGSLSKTYTSKQFINYCKETLKINELKIIGNVPEKINKLAIIGGSGSSNIDDVKALGADVYITGDVTYHHALHALEINQCIFDVGHHIEDLAMPAIKELLIKNGVTCDVHISMSDVNPYKKV
jgi:dinuclear metal center YbgI/SA1388 family protein